jgi:predicted nucleotidyltransferase
MQLAEAEQSVATRFAELVRASLPDQVLSLCAFGSRARGEGRPDSDLDVLVLVRDNDWRQRRHIYGLADDAMYDHDYRIALSPLVMAQAEFEQMVARERRLALDILRDRIPL